MEQTLHEVVQALLSVAQAIQTALSAAGNDLWHQDRPLFFALVVISFQTVWILNLRFRLGRVRRQLRRPKPPAAEQPSSQPHPAGGNRTSVWAKLRAKTRTGFRLKASQP